MAAPQDPIAPTDVSAQYAAAVTVSDSTAYLPTRGLWVGGAGTAAISDQSTGGGVYGLGVSKEAGFEFPMLSRGGIALGEGSALADAAVAANVLTFNAPYHVVTCTGAQTITSLSGPAQPDCRLVTFRTTNANSSFTDSASLELAGGVTFTGPGLIEFLIDSTVAYERGRTVL